jgi:hypothetical protein
MNEALGFATQKLAQLADRPGARPRADQPPAPIPALPSDRGEWVAAPDGIGFVRQSVVAPARQKMATAADPPPSFVLPPSVESSKLTTAATMEDRGGGASPPQSATAALSGVSATIEMAEQIVKIEGAVRDVVKRAIDRAVAAAVSRASSTPQSAQLDAKPAARMLS